MTKPRPRRPFVAFDWDGVLHAKRSFSFQFGEIDLAPIREAHRRGWAVAIMTANDRLEAIAAELAAQGILALADPRMVHGDWQGGRAGRTVLVTGRKVWADVFVDDRAVTYQFGQPQAGLFEEISDRLAG